MSVSIKQLEEIFDTEIAGTELTEEEYDYLNIRSRIEEYMKFYGSIRKYVHYYDLLCQYALEDKILEDLEPRIVYWIDCKPGHFFESEFYHRFKDTDIVKEHLKQNPPNQTTIMSEKRYKKIDNYFETLKNEPEKIDHLYNKNFVNWRGPKSKEKQPYTDYVAQKLLALNDPFSKISESSREKYFVEGHDGTIDQFTNRSEEIFAKLLLGHEIEELGRIIDYQLPLKETQVDNYGKIDLVSLNSKTNTGYLIELKMSSDETILRAALEIETYFRLIKQDTLQDYIAKRIKKFNAEDIFDGLPFKKTKIKKAIVYAGEDVLDSPYEITERERNSYPHLKKLMIDYNIEAYLIKKQYPTQSMLGLF